MQLVSIGNVILNLDQISALDIDRREDDTLVCRILTDSPEPILEVSLAPEVPDLLLNLVPQKMRFVGFEAVEA